MPRRTALLHVGRPLPGGPDHHAALVAHADLLAPAGYAPVDVSADVLTRAALEILREHRAAGLRRRDVEGAWADVCRRARRTRGHVVISQPWFASASREQAALALDGLAGFDVHLVVTRIGGRPDVLPVVDTWAPCVRPGRVHVVPLADDAMRVDLAEEIAGLALTIEGSRARPAPATYRRLRRSPRRGRVPLPA